VATDEIRDFTGLIVQVNNSPIPWSKGVIGPGGIAFIPFNVLSGNISLSAYDPITGFYDDNVAQVKIGDPLSEVHAISLLFDPDTTVLRHTLSIAQITQATVSTTTPRHEYRFFVPPSAIGSKLNVGLRAEEPLTFWLQDPAGHFVVRDSSTDCGFEKQFTPTQSGTYVITVTYGVSGGDGPFTVGVNYAPCPSSPFLCGTIAQDSLYGDCLEYIVRANTQVTTNDTVNVQAGTVIQFAQGVSITATGVLQGIATPSNPVILKPTDSGQQTVMSFPRVNNKRRTLQAEGKR
jgi:hypothetical protein